MHVTDQLRKLSEYLNTANYEQALDMLESMDRDAWNDQVRFIKAKAHAGLKQYAQAIEVFSFLVVNGDNKPHYLAERALAHYLAGHHQESIRDFDEAQELEPENPYRYSSRAFIKAAIGDTEGAIEDYNKAIDIDPEDAISHNNKAMLLEKIGYYEQAKKTYEIADTLDSNAVKNSSQATEKSTANQRSATAKRLAIAREVLTSKAGWRSFYDYWKSKIKK